MRDIKYYGMRNAMSTLLGMCDFTYCSNFHFAYILKSNDLDMNFPLPGKMHSSDCVTYGLWAMYEYN